MTVFVVEHDYYKADYGSWWTSIHAIFLKEEDAKKSCDNMNKDADPSWDHYSYSEWDVE